MEAAWEELIVTSPTWQTPVVAVNCQSAHLRLRISKLQRKSSLLQRYQGLEPMLELQPRRPRRFLRIQTCKRERKLQVQHIISWRIALASLPPRLLHYKVANKSLETWARCSTIWASTQLGISNRQSRPRTPVAMSPIVAVIQRSRKYLVAALKVALITLQTLGLMVLLIINQPISLRSTYLHLWFREVAAQRS